MLEWNHILFLFDKINSFFLHMNIVWLMVFYATDVLIHYCSLSFEKMCCRLIHIKNCSWISGQCHTPYSEPLHHLAMNDPPPLIFWLERTTAFFKRTQITSLLQENTNHIKSLDMAKENIYTIFYFTYLAIRYIPQ